MTAAGGSGHGPDREHDRHGEEPRPPAGGREAEGTVAQFSVPEMDCPSCAGKVETSVGKLDGIAAIEPDIAAGRLTVTYDPARVDRAAIVDRIEGAGYAVAGGAAAEEDGADDTREEVWTSPRAVRTGVGGLFLAAGIALAAFLPAWNRQVASVLGQPIPAADALFLVAVALSGGAIFRGGYYSARTLNLDIDFLMSVAILGALVASLAFGERLYVEAATLAVLFSFSELLERYSMDRARESLRELMDLSPEEATLVEDGVERTVPVGDLVAGDRVVVRPGSKMPADGVVLEGSSAVNQAPITGESVPVDKTAGDEVFAGTINEEGYLEVEVTAPAGEDTLSRVIDLVDEARRERTDREQFVERFADYYTPAVVAFAVLVTLASPAVLGTTWSTAVVHGLTLLVLACPCALVISTPVSVVSGLTSAARNGVLIKGGSHLEAAGEVGAVALDKTGTLTTGELTVTDVLGLNGNTEAEVLRCARGLEARSEHPIGEAIVARAGEGAGDGSRDQGHVEDFESLAGRGVRATLDGEPHYAGKPGLFEELGFDLSHVHATTDGGVVTTTSRRLCERNDCLDLLEEAVPRLQAEGKTVVLVGTEAELEGVIAVADEIRPEAERAVERLRELGVEHVAMLTGDNERTARAVAAQVGVDEVRAELLPEGKVEAVRDLDEAYGGVAMVGDGVNDAPALAAATVGVAMGAAGTDTALETADIALLGDDLSKLPYLYELAGDAGGIIRTNVWASIAAKAGLALAVPFGYVPIWLAVLAGDAGMTVAVTGNAMRLSRVRPD
jgi:Cd2+/Zn2+-exporting ATPase